MTEVELFLIQNYCSPQTKRPTGERAIPTRIFEQR